MSLRWALLALSAGGVVDRPSRFDQTIGAEGLGAPGPSAQTAIARLVQEVAAQIASADPLGPVAMHVSAPTPEAGRAFLALLGPALQRRDIAAMAMRVADAEVETAARDAGAGSLVRVVLSVEGGLLSARGDLFRIRPNFWSGLTATRIGPSAAIATATAVDAHALTLAASPVDQAELRSLEPRLEPTPLAVLPAQTAALASADLDADGRDELVALTSETLFVLSPSGAILARHELSGLPLGPSSSREPFGTLAILPGTPSRIGYFSGRHGVGEWLLWSPVDRTLTPGGAVSVPTFAVGGREVQAGWLPGTHLFRMAGFEEALVHFTTLTTPQGELSLGVRPDGAAGWIGPSAPSPPFALGAAAGMTGWEGGQELATSSAERFPSPERLRGLTLAGEPLWELTVERGRVLQLVAADLDGDARPEWVAAAWLEDGTCELRIVRRGSR